MTLTEVKENQCSHLTMVLGMLEENIARDFQAIDENGDGLVSKQEAYETLTLDRGKCNWDMAGW